MQQLSSLITVFAILTVLSARFVTEAASDGHWGEAIGTLFIGPLLFFFVLHTVLYGVARFLRGREGVASYTGSKINCLSALMTILATIAAA